MHACAHVTEYILNNPQEMLCDRGTSSGSSYVRRYAFPWGFLSVSLSLSLFYVLYTVAVVGAIKAALSTLGKPSLLLAYSSIYCRLLVSYFVDSWLAGTFLTNSCSSSLLFSTQWIAFLFSSQVLQFGHCGIVHCLVRVVHCSSKGYIYT